MASHGFMHVSVSMYQITWSWGFKSHEPSLVCTANGTQVLFQSSMYSYQLNHLPGLSFRCSEFTLSFSSGFLGSHSIHRVQ